MKSSGVCSSRKTPTLLDALRHLVAVSRRPGGTGVEHRVPRRHRRVRALGHELADRADDADDGRRERGRPVIEPRHPDDRPRLDAESSRRAVADEQLVGRVSSGQAAGHEHRHSRPRREVGAVDLHHRGRAARPVDARRQQHHRPRRPGGEAHPGHRADGVQLGRRDVRVARLELVRRPRFDALRAEVDEDVGRFGSGEELVDGDGGAATGCPGRQRHGGGETSEHRQRARGDPVPADERARPHPCRLAHHRAPLWRHGPRSGQGAGTWWARCGQPHHAETG